MTLLIATFGRTVNRRRAAIKYFLYTFIPSAILLVGMLWVYASTGTFQLPDLAQLAATHSISGNSAALWLASLAFLVAFAVKVPAFPLHGWLSDAIAEAPTAAVMVLAGKLGLYSILRFSFSIFPEQSRHIAPLMIPLAVLGRPMVTGFAGAFLRLPAAMESLLTHPTRCPVLAHRAVTFPASFILWMIQHVFYGVPTDNSADVLAPELDGREHLAIWP